MCADPDYAKTDSGDDLVASVFRRGARGIKGGQEAEAYDDEDPPDIILWSVAVDDLNGNTAGDGEKWDGERHPCSDRFYIRLP